MTSLGSRSVARSERAKRLFDLAITIPALVLLSPLIVAIAIAVRVRLGSPVIFRQQRPGLHGQAFAIHKFRSMTNATDEDGRLLDDMERTPPFGRRLRALSLDELPELWNVLRGDMSLVGPRPLKMSYLPLYSAQQMRRHDVRPGITGLAQVGGRNALTWEQKFALDVEYVDHHDLPMDMAILVRTLRVVVFREGIHHGHEEEGYMPEFTGSETAAQTAERE